ncbi:MAG: hypothetical protein IJ690_04350 [Clostridia bacterium]|nr:hypothetical protein [Clostridia bacterium]
MNENSPETSNKIKKNEIGSQNSKVEKVKDICIAVLLIIIFIYFILGINSLSHGDKMGFFNLRFYIMSSESVETSSNAGDLVVARKIKPERVKENDRIIYKKNNRTYIKNADISDQQNGEVVGKVLFKIRGLGNIAMFMKTPLGILNMLMIALCVVIIIKKITQNKEEEKYNE